MKVWSFKELSEKLSSALGLVGHPVGVTMIEKSDELSDIAYKEQPIKRLSKQLAVCQLISQARYLGRVIAAHTCQLSICRLGADSLGVNVGDYAHVYTGTYFKDEQAALNMIETTPKFERGKYEAIVVAPLHKIPLRPDVVVVYANAAQILRIVNGYLYNKGGRIEFSASGDAGLCADTVVMPMLTGQPHVAIPCNGGRILSLPNVTDLACGIPYMLLNEVIEGIEFTARNVPITYPPLWQHIDWELRSDAPIYRFLQQDK